MSQIVKNGIDYSSGQLTGQQVLDSGNEFVCKYLSEDRRALTQREVDSFRDTGVGIVIIGEYDRIDSDGNQISAMLGGSAAGYAQAVYADSIRKVLGLPDQPIYFTLDVEPGSVPWTLVGAYLDAAENVIGKNRVGFYAGLDGIDWYVNTWGGNWPWQTYAWSFRNGGYQLHPKAKLYQYDIYGESVAGVDVDLNKAFVENYGQTQAFENQPLPGPVYATPLHPDWFASSLAIRYPTVGRWIWNGQTLVLDTIRHNAKTVRRTNQYAEPTTNSAHAGPLLDVEVKVSVERITDVLEVRNGKTRKRTWVLTGNGTWIPEDTLDIDFTIRRRKPKA